MLDLGTFKVLWDVIFYSIDLKIFTFCRGQLLPCETNLLCRDSTVRNACRVKRQITDLEQSPLNSLAQGKVK